MIVPYVFPSVFPKLEISICKRIKKHRKDLCHEAAWTDGGSVRPAQGRKCRRARVIQKVTAIEQNWTVLGSFANGSHLVMSSWDQKCSVRNWNSSLLSCLILAQAISHAWLSRVVRNCKWLICRERMWEQLYPGPEICKWSWGCSHWAWRASEGRGFPCQWPTLLRPKWVCSGCSPGSGRKAVQASLRYPGEESAVMCLESRKQF